MSLEPQVAELKEIVQVQGQRLKVLEDLTQRVTQAFIAAPTQTVKQKPEGPEPSTKTVMFKEATIKNTVSQLNGDITPQHYIEDKELWNQINNDLTSHGYKWIKDGKFSRWTKQ